MGRKAKLTPEQAHRLLERHLEGESLRSLAREVGLSEGTLRNHISERANTVKTAAHHMVSAETTLKKLDLSAQATAKTLASRTLRALETISSGNELMAGSYMKLAMLNQSLAQRLDESDPLSEETADIVTRMAFAGKSANIAAETVLKTAALFKEAASAEDDESNTLVIQGGMED